MNITDRDKKIIYVLAIIAVIVLPYFLYIKDKRTEIAGVKAEVVALEERLKQLQEMDLNRDVYIKETEQFNKDRDVIIESFPAGISPETYTMFLLNTEYSSFIEDPVTHEYIWQYPLRFDTVSYGDNEETPISNEQMDTGYTALANTSSLTYMCYYDGLKYMLEYLMEYEDPMVYRTISMDFDKKTGVISGMMKLDQYAIEGADREFAPVVIKPDLDENKLRGNEELGIFGPISSYDPEAAEEEGDTEFEAAEGEEVDAEAAEEKEADGKADKKDAE